MKAEEFLEGSLPLMCGQTPQNVLLRALWVLRAPSRWVCFRRAVDANWDAVDVNDPRAVRWSVDGAVAAASNPQGVLAPYFQKLLDEVVLEMYGEDGGINCLEEYCSHGIVVRVLFRAAEKAGQSEG